MPLSLRYLYNTKSNITSERTCRFHRDLFILPAVKTTSYGVRSLRSEGASRWNQFFSAHSVFSDIKSQKSLTKYFKLMTLDKYLDTSFASILLQ